MSVIDIEKIAFYFSLRS